ncbi:MAG: oligoendopeptidase F family protein [bacterium]|nr:oligoendopeptidase F family protein [bacterium]
MSYFTHFMSGWIDVPHFFYNYYVISYTGGMIASMALHEMVEKGGEKERDRYLRFLASGSSDTPVNLWKRAGVDMTSPRTYAAAFRKLDGLIAQMEKIAARLKAAGKL